MDDILKNNKRIAKNTIFLYFRQFLILAITLYTSRVILKTLGVEDYGIYNVVGGVVAMMGMLNASMSVATQRFITYELGKGNLERLKLTFSSSFILYLILGVIFVLCAETIGVWFLNTQLVIPDERMVAANWVFQLSIIASINSLLVNPYNACIIAHEHMNVYAYVSILEVVLKLLVAFSLPLLPFDRLIVYGVLILISQLIITMVYRIYCIRHFEECHVSFHNDKKLFLKILSFSGWNLFGSVATLLKTQGLNIIINMFFSPVVNASRGIAVQINNAVSQFFSNFYTAFRPQITKYYAQGDLENMIRLVNKSTLYSYYLIFLISFPILLETPMLIDVWLGQTPQYAVEFARLIILISVVDSLSHPLMTTVQATGKIKYYQMTVGLILMLNVPFSYFGLKLGGSPTLVFEISLFLSCVCVIIRLAFVRKLINFPVKKYIVSVYGKGLLVSFIAGVLPTIIHIYLNTTMWSSILVVFSSVILTIVTIYFVGISAKERDIVNGIVVKTLIRRKK